MLSFKQYLEEKLITFGGKAYPKFGQVIILAGGAGSGKGFIKDKLIGAEGWNFDVDELKKLAAKTPYIVKKIKDELGFDLSTLDVSKSGQELVLKDPANVFKLHDIVGNVLNLDNKKTSTLYTSILTANPERKPNLIFDVTLKDLQKLNNISRQVTDIGYDLKNIHIVWIVNDIEIAKKQNLARERTVPVEILINTHRGASQTMHDIIDMGSGLKRYMDGDIVLAFNKVDIDKKIFDTEFVFGKGQTKFSKKDVGYVKGADYVYVKRAGKPVTPSDKISKDIKAKIAKYVPKNVEWV